MTGTATITTAYARFTSCSGCQLMLLNCEDSLLAFAQQISLQAFPLVSSAITGCDRVDLALVEGAISKPEEVARLMELRRQASFLVAVGSCALTGGVNSLVPGERAQAIRDVYGETPAELLSFTPQPVGRFVTVDFAVPGCPPERQDLLEVLASLPWGGWPGRQVMPVCMECRILENPCLLTENHLPCIGPVTQAGCRARCPSVGVPCEGCRGVVAEANFEELYRLLLEAGLSEYDVEKRLTRFARSGPWRE
jgi:sulfhydrogenase subunit delta